MTTAQTDHYSDLSADYLRKARLHFSEGDLTQASEKGWGAASTAVKACAEERGWDHHRHWHHRANLRQLIDETGDTELSTDFANAEALYANFYEGFMRGDEAELHLERVERLVGKLRQLV